MKRTALTLAALLALASVSLAQDAPPPKEGAPAAPAAEKKPEKHVNKITEAAKAAFDGIQKVIYSPIVAGLKDLQGTIEMKMYMAGGEDGPDMGPGMGMSFDVVFKAPTEMKVGMKGGEMLGPQAEGIREGVKQIVLNALGVWMPAGDEEFDADLVTEEGKKILVVTSYKDGKKDGVIRITLADNGLPVSAVAISEMEMMPGTKPVEQRVKMKWDFAKEGEFQRLEKWIIEIPQMPMPMEYRIEYADAGGFKLPVKFIMDLSAMGMVAGYRFTKLTVNGKEIPVASDKKEEAKPGTPTKAGDKDEGEDGDEGDDEGDDEGEDDDGGM